MIELYLQLRLKILYRIIRKIGILLSSGITAFFVVLMFYLGSQPSFYLLGLYIILAGMIHQSRQDKMFLRTLFPETFHRLYILDNLLLGIPVIMVICLQKNFIELPILLILAIFLAYLPQTNINLRLFTHPLLMKGSLEYQRAARLFNIPYLLLTAAAVIGLFYDNIRITEVNTGIMIALTSILLLIPVHRPYLYHYASAQSLIRRKALQAGYNTLVILFPFLLLFLIGAPSRNHLSLCLVVYMAAAMLFFQIDLLRIICNPEDLVMVILYIGLLGLSFLATGIPWLLILSFFTALYIALRTYFFLKKIL